MQIRKSHQSKALVVTRTQETVVSSPSDALQQLVIVGGGYGGVCTALKTAEHLRDAGDQPFHVTLIEKEPDLFRSTALLAGQLHGGNEYPLHWATAAACLRSAIRWRLEMPDADFYTDRDPMIYTGSVASQAIGKRCEAMILTGQAVKLQQVLQRKNQPEKLRDSWLRCNTKRPLTEGKPLYEEDYTLESSTDGVHWKPVQKRSKWQWDDGYVIDTDEQGKLLYLTVDRMIDHCNKLKELYRELFEQVRKERGWTVEQTEDALLGPVEKFYQALDKKMPFEHAGGFRSAEIGINVPFQLAYLQKALETLAADDRVTIKTGCEVAKITPQDGRFLLTETVKDKAGKPVKHDGKNVTKPILDKQGKPLIADRVVTAAWDGNPALNGLREGEKITVYHRAILYFNIRSITQSLGGLELNPAFVMRGDTHASLMPSAEIAHEGGGMWAPRNERLALVYSPTNDGAYRYGWRVFTKEHTELPPEWKTGYFPVEKCNALQAKWLAASVPLSQERFPSLKGEGARPPESSGRKMPGSHPDMPPPHAIGIGIANALNFQYGKEQREHETAREIMPGWVTTYPTKATHAWRCADEVLLLLQARERDLHNPEPMRIDEKASFLAAIRGDLAIRKYDKPDDKYLWIWMEKRDLDPEFADMHRGATGPSRDPRGPSKWPEAIKNPFLDGPKIQQLYQLDPFSQPLQPARKAVDRVFKQANRIKENGDFGERFKLIYPPKEQLDRTVDHSSVVNVVIPAHQPLHIHPKEGAHRLLILTTGKRSGIVNWFAPKGTLNYDRTAEAGPTAEGDHTGHHHRYQLEPYSSYIIELGGGVHSFGNVIIQSYHPLDVAKSKQPAPATSAPGTALWISPSPREKRVIASAAPYYKVGTLAEFKDFHRAEIKLLKQFVDEGPQPKPEYEHYIERFLEEFTPGLPKQEGFLNLAAPVKGRGGR